MILNAMVLSGDVQEAKFYDQATGAEKLSYAVVLTVLDVDTDEKYECVLSDGFPRLEELKEMRRRGAPPDALRQVADQLRGDLPPRLTTLPLEVLRFRGKQASFIRLVCRFAQVAQAATA